MSPLPSPVPAHSVQAPELPPTTGKRAPFGWPAPPAGARSSSAGPTSRPPPSRSPQAKPLASLVGIHPAWREWPWAESYFNVRDYRINEYTVSTNMAYILLMRAYLAQTLAR
ncbi:MAG: hypothetical protein H7Y06_09425 [Opitutaceae bacterium]|nr:hypothetical protein [Opitutaceae bacterium]